MIPPDCPRRRSNFTRRATFPHGNAKPLQRFHSQRLRLAGYGLTMQEQVISPAVNHTTGAARSELRVLQPHLASEAKRSGDSLALFSTT